jgi:hypothetical protein
MTQSQSTRATCYIVTWDISAEPVRTALVERLKGYGAHCPITRHCWAIRTDRSAPSIRDDLKAVLAAGDRLFVIRSGVRRGRIDASQEE